MPASAATAPVSTNSTSLVRLTRTPENRAASSLAPTANTALPNELACSSTANTTASTANSRIGYGRLVPGTGVVPNWV